MSARGRRGLVIAALAAVLLTATPAAAQPIDGGDVRISPTEGGSATPFSLLLPDGASCPGDSRDEGYRVNSYMVPEAVDPLDVTYGGEGPTPFSFGDYATFREPLFDLETNWFVSAQTADAEDLGDPGRIVNMPQFSHAVFAAGDVPAGRYNVGIVCTLDNEIVTIWRNKIEVTEDPADVPTQIHWRVVGATGSGSSSSSGSTAPIAAAVAVTAVLLVVYVRRRRHQPITTPVEDR